MVLFVPNRDSELQDPLVSPSGGFQPPVLPRPITSTLDTWDQSTQVDYAISAASIGSRPSWNVPSLAVTSEPVNSIHSSAATRFATPSFPTRAGMTLNPTNAANLNTANRFRVIPNMAQSIKPDSSVQISFSVLITAATNTSPRFAIFRDGRLISAFYNQVIVANIQSLVSGTYVDPIPTRLKWHTYDFRWWATDVAIKSFEKNRTFQVSNLRAT